MKRKCKLGRCQYAFNVDRLSALGAPRLSCLASQFLVAIGAGAR